MAGGLGGWLVVVWLVAGLLGCMVAGLHGCMAACLHGCMVAWLHGGMVAWWHGCLVVVRFGFDISIELYYVHCMKEVNPRNNSSNPSSCFDKDGTPQANNSRRLGRCASYEQIISSQLTRINNINMIHELNKTVRRAHEHIQGKSMHIHLAGGCDPTHQAQTTSP